MSLLLQVSDPHFGTEQPAVMDALTRLAREQAPQVLVVSGDITQRARRAQFDAARRFVDGLGVPTVLSVPGNHDIPLFNLFARMLSPYAGYSRVFGTHLEPDFETPELLLLCVNSTRARRHSDGELSAAQIARVAERLRGAAQVQLRVVVTHQPLHVYRERDAHNRVHGHAQALRAWAAAGADVVMGGHIHLPFVRHVPDLPRRLWCVQAGTAVSHRVRPGAPNSVNLLRYGGADAPRAVVERWDYDAGSASFHRAEITVIEPERA